MIILVCDYCGADAAVVVVKKLVVILAHWVHTKPDSSAAQTSFRRGCREATSGESKPSLHLSSCEKSAAFIQRPPFTFSSPRPIQTQSQSQVSIS